MKKLILIIAVTVLASLNLSHADGLEKNKKLNYEKFDEALFFAPGKYEIDEIRCVSANDSTDTPFSYGNKCDTGTDKCVANPCPKN